MLSSWNKDIIISSDKLKTVITQEEVAYFLNTYIIIIIIIIIIFCGQRSALGCFVHISKMAYQTNNFTRTTIKQLLQLAGTKLQLLPVIGVLPVFIAFNQV